MRLLVRRGLTSRHTNPLLDTNCVQVVVSYGKMLGVRDGDFDKLCCRAVEVRPI